jgi:hypothetical protein
MDRIDQLLSEIGPALKPLIDAVYQAGYADGRAAAKADLHSKMSALLLDDNVVPVEPYGKATPNEQTEAESDRAAPGTVKPAILKLIKDHPEGLTRRDIIDLTGFKVNSVRGTLWQLHAVDREIDTHKGKWYPKGSPQYVEDIGGPQYLELDDGSEEKEPPDTPSSGSETGSDDDVHSFLNHIQQSR